MILYMLHYDHFYQISLGLYSNFAVMLVELSVPVLRLCYFSINHCVKTVAVVFSYALIFLFLPLRCLIVLCLGSFALVVLATIEYRRCIGFADRLGPCVVVVVFFH